MLSCLVRQKQWGWEITAAMTVNTSKIKNSDGGSDGNNHDMMLKNITHTPWHPGSSIKEQNKWINTHSWPISFREVSPKLWLFYCLQIVSNTSTNPCFGNKRINCCMGIFIAMVSFSGYFRYTLKKKKPFRAYHKRYQATYWLHHNWVRMNLALWQKQDWIR